jgi:hypothetical protein
MPKELCHWMIARQAARKLDTTATPRTKEAVQACPEAFLLGAVAPDGPFYVPGDARLVAIATLLHGQGAVVDAFAPVKRVIGAGAAAASPAAMAFAAGVLCHIAADTVFHPAIFYFTGFSAHASATVKGAYLYRHRSFETAMDLQLLAEHGSGLERRLDRLLARASARPDAGELVAAVARCYATAGQPPSTAEAARILEQAGKTQRLFFSKPLWALLCIRHIYSAGRNPDTSALFYARTTPWTPTFSSPRPYRDPVSGVDGVFDLGECFSRAVDRTVSLCGNLERALAGEATAFPHPGPSLESGHPLDQDQQMKHCDPALTETARAARAARRF